MMENGKRSISMQSIVIVAGMIVAGLASYYTSRIGLAEELGNRPTRAEVQQQITEIKETIVREVKDIKDSQAEDAKQYQSQQQEVRQDIRRLTDIIIEKLK